MLGPKKLRKTLFIRFQNTEDRIVFVNVPESCCNQASDKVKKEINYHEQIQLNTDIL